MSREIDGFVTQLVDQSEFDNYIDVSDEICDAVDEGEAVAVVAQDPIRWLARARRTPIVGIGVQVIEFFVDILLRMLFAIPVVGGLLRDTVGDYLDPDSIRVIVDAQSVGELEDVSLSVEEAIVEEQITEIRGEIEEQREIQLHEAIEIRRTG